MIYCFDIDGVICDTQGTNYEHAIPRPSVIQRINKLHVQGHKIIIYTARGSDTHVDYGGLTAQQLLDWNVYYDLLFMGKPNAQIYVDDRAVNFHDWYLLGKSEQEGWS